jgi:hypothetical protein
MSAFPASKEPGREEMRADRAGVPSGNFSIPVRQLLYLVRGISTIARVLSVDAVIAINAERSCEIPCRLLIAAQFLLHQGHKPHRLVLAAENDYALCIVHEGRHVDFGIVLLPGVEAADPPDEDERSWQGQPPELSARDQGNVDDPALAVLCPCRMAHPDMRVESDERSCHDVPPPRYSRMRGAKAPHRHSVSPGSGSVLLVVYGKCDLALSANGIRRPDPEL